MKKDKRKLYFLIGGVITAAAVSVGLWRTEWLKALGKVICEIIGSIFVVIMWCIAAVGFLIADITAPTPPEPTIQKQNFTMN